MYGLEELATKTQWPVRLYSPRPQPYSSLFFRISSARKTANPLVEMRGKIVHLDKGPVP
jgi:hypothetical protein